VRNQPLAVFDSGLGGLTVVRALRELLPGEDLVYFGDTARVPYGNKTPETVLGFSREICGFLLRMNPNCIVAACNTVSATCLGRLCEEVPVPVVGVVMPGARAAVARCGAGSLIGVIATEATVASDAYRSAIQSVDGGRAVVQTACPLFVPMAEEGLGADDPIVGLVIDRYLRPLKRLNPAAVLMGCTHYPVLAEGLAGFFGDEVVLVDSARATAGAVREELAGRGLLSGRSDGGSLHCYVSDNPRRFQAVGWRFLRSSVPDVVRVGPEATPTVGGGGGLPGTRASA